MSINCPGPSQPVRNIELSRIINNYLNSNNQIIVHRSARENVFNEQQTQCDLYICISEKHFRLSLMLKKKNDLVMKIMKLLMLNEREHKYKVRQRIISNTNVATIVSYEDYDNE